MRRRLPLRSHSPWRLRVLQALVLLAVFAITTSPAWAASLSSMPWDDPLNKVLSSLTGPFAKAVATIAIVILGVGLAFSEGGATMRKALWVGMGIALTFGAGSLLTTVFTFTGGVLV